MDIIRKKLFYLSSADRQSTDSIQSWNLVFPDNLMSVKSNELLRLTLISFNQLNTYLYINNNNNTFFCVFNTTLGSFYSVINMTIGNWNITQICQNLVVSLDTAFGTPTFSMTIPTASTNYGLISWTDPTLNSMQWYFNYRTAPIQFQTFINAIDYIGTSARILGQSISTDNVIITNNYTTPLSIYTGAIQYLRLHTNIPPINIAFNKKNNQLNYVDYFAQIPILVEPDAPIVYQSFQDTQNNFDMSSLGQKIGTITLTLTDELNNPVIVVDDYSFVLAVSVLVENEQDAILKEQLHLQKISLIKI